MRRSSQCLPGPVDVTRYSTRQSRNDWPSDRRGNCLYRFEVAVGGNGKARFDHVHAEDIQLLSQAHFLLYVHAAARRLLAVAKCRVENGNAWSIHGIHPPGKTASRLRIG